MMGKRDVINYYEMDNNIRRIPSLYFSQACPHEQPDYTQPSSISELNDSLNYCGFYYEDIF